MDEKIILILNEMSEYLSITQMKKLQEVIIKTFADNEACKIEISNEEFLKMFTDRGSVVEIFTDLSVWMGIRKVIDMINANAVA